MIYVKYMTRTLREAKLIGLMAKRLHGDKPRRGIVFIPLKEDEPVSRKPQCVDSRVSNGWLVISNGKARVVDCRDPQWVVGTDDPDFSSDDRAWDQAIEYYRTRAARRDAKKRSTQKNEDKHVVLCQKEC